MRKIFIIGGLVLLLIASVGFGGYFYFKTETSQPVEQGFISTSTKSPELALTAIENVDSTKTSTPTIILTVKPVSTMTTTLRNVESTQVIPTTTQTSVPEVQVATLRFSYWAYPGNPACDWTQKVKNGEVKSVRLEQLTLEQDGNVKPKLQSEYGCWGYPEGTQFIKQYEIQKTLTISAQVEGFRELAKDPNKVEKLFQQAVQIAQEGGFKTIELDWEGLGQFTKDDFNAYMATINLLNEKLHKANLKLAIDLPAVTKDQQSWYPQIQFIEIGNLPIDEIVVMVYDNQYDERGGSAITPMAKLVGTIEFFKEFVSLEKLTIGLPAYGYEFQCGGYSGKILTFDQLKNKPGFNKATRDSESQEMMWKQGDMCYSYVDETALYAKVQTASDLGISNFAIWHLGGDNPIVEKP